MIKWFRIRIIKTPSMRNSARMMNRWPRFAKSKCKRSLATFVKSSFQLFAQYYRKSCNKLMPKNLRRRWLFKMQNYFKLSIINLPLEQINISILKQWILLLLNWWRMLSKKFCYRLMVMRYLFKIKLWRQPQTYFQKQYLRQWNKRL